jgi:hypothetical protein
MFRFETITKAGFLGSMALALIPLGCGGIEPTIRQQQSPTPEHPPVPQITAERLQECVKEHGHQLEGGSWAFSPTIQVNREGYVDEVNAGEIPKTAPDLAACIRIALGDMAIPSHIFNLRSTQSDTATNEPTMAQRSYIGSPAVVVVVVVGLSEIVLEAGAVTILFAVTVKVVDKAVDDVAEAIKNRRKPWKDACTTHYENCIDSPAGRARGNVWNQTRCGLCKRSCDLRKIWPPAVIVWDEWESCY